MDRLKGFVSSIWSFVCLVSVMGGGIIVVAVLMTSTANADFLTLKALTPDKLYLPRNTSGQFTITMSGPAEPGGLVVSLSLNGSPGSIIYMPETVTIPALQDTATFTVTSGSAVGEAWVFASYMADMAIAHIFITADIPPPPVTIPSAVLLLWD